MNYCFISGFSQPASTMEILGAKLSNKNAELVYSSPDKLFPDYLNNLDKLIKNKTTLVGWSLGGCIALEYANKFPKKIEKIILISSTSCFLKNENNPDGIEKEKLEALITGVKNSRAITLKRFISKFSSKETESFYRNSVNINSEILVDNLNQLKKDLQILTSNITQPVIIFHDEKDKIIPFSHAKKLNNLISNSKLFTTSGFGHILEEQNVEFIVNRINS